MKQPPSATYVCPFKKAILHAHLGCENAVRRVAAVQSSIACGDQAAQLRCRALFGDLLAASRFTLRVDGPSDSIPNGKLIRLQAGGLFGVQRLLNDSSMEREHADGLENIHGLLDRAQARFGSLHDLPFDRVVRGITAYRVKRRRRPSGGTDS